MAARRSKAAREQQERDLAQMGYMLDERFANMINVKPKTLHSRSDFPARHKLGRLSVRKIDDVKAWLARRAVAR